MSLLEHPEAQALLDDANLTPQSVRGCADRLTEFLQRYLPKFYRIEQRRNATTVIRGLLSGLERKGVWTVQSAPAGDWYSSPTARLFSISTRVDWQRGRTTRFERKRVGSR